MAARTHSIHSLCRLFAIGPIVLWLSPMAVVASPLDYPTEGCVLQQGIQAACDTSGIKFDLFQDQEIQQDIQLIYSRNFLQSVTGYPYMEGNRINAFLRSLDLDTGQNEFHLPWRDYQLIFNYFHGKDSTGYYGSFGVGNPRMRFFDSDSLVAVGERNHVDIYFVHKDDIGASDTWPSYITDAKEDGDPAACSEYHTNSLSASVGFLGELAPSNPCAVLVTPDSTWHVPGKGSNVRVNHETQHLIDGSQEGSFGSGFLPEQRSMAAEYLVGARPRDADRPENNSLYDWP